MEKCVTCQTAQIHESLSMHCWECFNKRFEDEPVIKAEKANIKVPLTKQQEDLLKLYMGGLLNKLDSVDKYDREEFLLDIITQWKVNQIYDDVVFIFGEPHLRFCGYGQPDGLDDYNKDCDCEYWKIYGGFN